MGYPSERRHLEHLREADERPIVPTQTVAVRIGHCNKAHSVDSYAAELCIGEKSQNEFPALVVSRRGD
jgi:hypothetical protein